MTFSMVLMGRIVYLVRLEMIYTCLIQVIIG